MSPERETSNDRRLGAKRKSLAVEPSLDISVSLILAKTIAEGMVFAESREEPSLTECIRRKRGLEHELNSAKMEKRAVLKINRCVARFIGLTGRGCDGSESLSSSVL